MELVCEKQGQEMELVRLAQRGSREAFDTLFHTHKEFVNNICYRMLGSIDDAADATQAAFVQAYKGLRGFKHNSEFRTWLYRIAVNVCTGMLRQAARRKRLDREMEIDRVPGEREDTLWAAVLELAPDARAVLVLFYFQELSVREVAEVLGCSEGAVKVRLHRARSSLRVKYEEMTR